MAVRLSGDRTPPRIRPGKHPGLSTAMELAIRFHLWAQQQRSLTAEAIQKHWEVSRATAYRWLSAYRAATGADA